MAEDYSGSVPDPQAQSQVTTGPTQPGMPGMDLKAQLNPIQLTPEEVDEWWKEVKRAESRVKEREGEWDILLDEYLPKVEKSGTPEAIKANIHFRNVHTKIGQLFVNSPKVVLVPEGPARDKVIVMDPMTGQPKVITAEEAVIVKQAVLSKFMGEDFIDGIELMDECLFDALAWAGMMVVKVGYKATTKTIQEPVMQPDPGYIPPPPQGGMLGLAPQQPPPMVPMIGPDGQPVTQPRDVPIHTEYYAHRIAPKKAIFDPELKSTRVDKNAKWVGHKVFMTSRQIMKDFGLESEELGSGYGKDDRVHEYKEDTVGAEGGQKRPLLRL